LAEGQSVNGNDNNYIFSALFLTICQRDWLAYWLPLYSWQHGVRMGAQCARICYDRGFSLRFASNPLRKKNIYFKMVYLAWEYFAFSSLRSLIMLVIVWLKQWINWDPFFMDLSSVFSGRIIFQEGRAKLFSLVHWLPRPSSSQFILWMKKTSSALAMSGWP
jgi:hypothetical protein